MIRISTEDSYVEDMYGGEEIVGLEVIKHCGIHNGDGK